MKLSHRFSAAAFGAAVAAVLGFGVTSAVATPASAAESALMRDDCSYVINGYECGECCRRQNANYWWNGDCYCY
jgi:hypothetical protein